MTRTALVTGSSRGIGAATVREFARRGDDVIVHYASDARRAEALAAELAQEYGVGAHALGADLTDPEAVAMLARRALDTYGHIDVLVNNAGIAPYGPVAEMSVDSWNRTLQANLIAPFQLAQALGARMVRNEYGKIVNIASIDAIYTYNAESAEYDASKAAIINLTHTLSLASRPTSTSTAWPRAGWIRT